MVCCTVFTAKAEMVGDTIKNNKDFNKITIKDRNGNPTKWESSLHLNVGMNAVLGAPDEYDFQTWGSASIGNECDS